MFDNSVLENIYTRRSVRKYESKQVADDLLEQVLESALWTPSALNKQPWQVRVVQSPKLLREINNRFVEWAAKQKGLQGSAARASEEDFSVFHHAPTLIVVFRDKNNHYSAGDCGMLAQNVMLSAHSLGLGSCVIGNVATVFSLCPKWFLEEMNVSDDYEVSFGIAIGYPAENPPQKPRDKDKFELIR